MELRVLKYFLTVAREESITEAANVLHITQPTLSRQMTDLEEELGTQLLIRGKRRVTLTDAGLLLRRRAEELSEMTERMEREIKAADSSVSGIISIGCGGVGSADIVIEAIERFRSKYPLVHYEIYTNSADYVKDRINKGLLDFGVLLEPVDIDRFDFVRLPHKENFGAIVSPNNALSKKTCLAPSDLEEVPLLIPSRSAIKNELASWFGAVYNKLNIIGESNLVDNAILLVKKNLAVMLAIDGAVQVYNKDYFKFVPLNPEMELSTVFVWKKHQPSGVAAAKFLDEIIMLAEHNK